LSTKKYPAVLTSCSTICPEEELTIKTAAKIIAMVGRFFVSESEKLHSPQDFFLNQNYPNPFNGSTQITFSTRLTGDVILSVYNLLGQKIITLFDDIATANTIYSITFDAKNLPSGIYLYSLRTIGGNEVKRMCLLK